MYKLVCAYSEKFFERRRRDNIWPFALYQRAGSLCFYSMLLVTLLLAACEKPLRLPYITPELQHWPKPYRGTPGLRLHIFSTGKIELPTKVVFGDGSVLGKQTMDILVFVLEHPRQGLVLFGTGLNHGLVSNAERHGGRLLTTIGRPKVAKGQDILSQLQTAKLPLEKVHHLILPDLRFDHTGGAESFSAAQVIVTVEEHNAVTDQEDQLSIASEYDQVRTWKFIDFTGAEPLGTFRAHRDLFGDGSVLLIDVAGATPGGLAALIRLPTGPVILCGNLAWTKEQYLYARLPGLLFDREAWWEKIWRLKKFKQLVPELIVLPDHDWAAAEAAKTKDMILHAFPDKLPSDKDKEPKAERGLCKNCEKESGIHLLVDDD
jgi:glyoxylase-like metal-dependent hydrolase (beta-lactamase superfamily II)